MECEVVVKESGRWAWGSRRRSQLSLAAICALHPAGSRHHHTPHGILNTALPAHHHGPIPQHPPPRAAPTSMYDTRSRNSLSWQAAMSWKTSRTARGMMPGSPGVPFMVWVLPEEVCP